MEHVFYLLMLKVKNSLSLTDGSEVKVCNNVTVADLAFTKKLIIKSDRASKHYLAQWGGNLKNLQMVMEVAGEDVEASNLSTHVIISLFS